jgi:hypothetical protein
MKSPKLLLVAILGLAVLSATAAPGQEKFQIHYRATVKGTNDSGRIVKARQTERSLIKECATDEGITNRRPLVLAYHVGGDLNGDVIEVINKNTGEVHCQKLRLLFPLTFTNGDESEIHQFVYVFSDQQSESVGSGMVTRKALRHGRTLISGSINFFLLPDGTNGLRFCNAHFSGSKPLPNPVQ